MHELSIAMSIVDIASRQAEAASAESVSQIELDIGTLSGIEYESLEFALTVAVKDSMFEHTRFKINRIEPLCECGACSHLYSPGKEFGACPNCGKHEPEFIRGKELQIKSLLVEQKE
ncbi:MAG: hydrogenase maturation nickel metallochaperone HypA [Bacteroidota bacterium]